MPSTVKRDEQDEPEGAGDYGALFQPANRPYRVVGLGGISTIPRISQRPEERRRLEKEREEKKEREKGGEN